MRRRRRRTTTMTTRRRRRKRVKGATVIWTIQVEILTRHLYVSLCVCERDSVMTFSNDSLPVVFATEALPEHKFFKILRMPQVAGLCSQKRC